MSWRANLGWVRHGSARTEATFATHAAAIGALQEQVHALTVSVAELKAELARSVTDDETSTTTLEEMRLQLRTITDDLGDRVGAVSARLESQLGA